MRTIVYLGLETECCMSDIIGIARSRTGKGTSWVTLRVVEVDREREAEVNSRDGDSVTSQPCPFFSLSLSFSGRT